MRTIKNGENAIVNTGVQHRKVKPHYIGVVLVSGVLIAGIVTIGSLTKDDSETKVSRVRSSEVAMIYDDIDHYNSMINNDYTEKDKEEPGVMDTLSAVAKSNLSADEKRQLLKATEHENKEEQENKEEVVSKADIQKEVIEKTVDNTAQVEQSQQDNKATVEQSVEEPVEESSGTVTYTGDGSKGAFKAYMDKDAITAKGSPQYKLKSQCTLNEQGVACVDGRMLVAVGTGHDAPVGSNIDVYLTTGKVLKCKVGDIKQNRHTDASNKICSGNGSIIEFLVETSCMNSKAKQMGDMSYAGYEGGITKIVKVG